MVHRKTQVSLLAVAALTAIIGVLVHSARAQDTLQTKDDIAIAVRLEHRSEREQAARDRLASVLAEYELRPWIYTREVLLTDEGYPHSHPVLTLTTDSDYYEDPVRQLSTFIHEQMHWLEEDPANGDAVDQAIADLREKYPNPPSHDEIGTRSEYSTYLHLVIGWQVLDAMTELVGEEKARRLHATADHYEWVYQTVLSDTETIGAVVAKHGLAVTPNRGLIPRSNERGDR